MTDPSDEAKRIVERQQNEGYDAELEERLAEESAGRARDYAAVGDWPFVAAEMGMPDLGVRLAEERAEEIREAPRRAAESRLRREERALAAARGLLERDESFRAQLELEGVLDVGSENPRVHFFYGVALFRQKEFSRAASSFSRAERLGAPLAECCRLGAECFLLSREPDRAVPLLDRAIVSAPGRADLHEMRSGALLSLSGTAEQESAWAVSAVRDARAALDAAPDEPSHYLSLGRALLRNRDFDECTRALQEAERRGVEGPHLSLLLGLAHSGLGDLEAAEEAFSEAIRKDTEQPVLLLHRARIRSRLGRSAEAIEDFTALIAHEPRRIRGYLGRGECHRAAGRLEAAREDFAAAGQLTKRSPQPPFHLARCLLEMAKPAEALAAVERSLQLGPNYGPALELREECRRLA